eukprot:Lankesteria_metandrocarpae@DN764_c0_g1_i2.p1
MGIFATNAVAFFVNLLLINGALLQEEINFARSSTDVVSQPLSGEHKYSVIFMHGFGDGRSVEEFVRGLLRNSKSEILRHTKFIMPLAQESVTVGRRSLPAWAALTTTIDPNVPEDEQCFRKSADRIQKYVRGEIAANIPASKIAVGGFSQGGAVAYLSGLEFPHSLWGIFAISSWVPLMDVDLRSKASWPTKPIRLAPQIKDTHMLHCHGIRK